MLTVRPAAESRDPAGLSTAADATLRAATRAAAGSKAGGGDASCGQRGFREQEVGEMLVVPIFQARNGGRQMELFAPQH